MCVWGCLQRGRRVGMAGIVMREEKVRQCKVFVVLMQRQHSCWGTSDAAAAPAWTQVCRAETGSTFYSPLPLCFSLNGKKEVESTADLQHSYVNKAQKCVIAVNWVESSPFSCHLPDYPTALDDGEKWKFVSKFSTCLT